MVLGSVGSDWFGWLCIWWFAMFGFCCCMCVLGLTWFGFGELLDTLVLCELSWHSLVCLGWCLDGVCVFAGWGWFRACFSSYLSLRLVTICLVWCLLGDFAAIDCGFVVAGCAFVVCFVGWFCSGVGGVCG